MRSLGVLAALLTFLSFLSGCAKELGRVPFSAPGAGETTMTLAAGEVGVWTDLDIEWEGPAALAYQVDLFQNGTCVVSTVCNPLGKHRVRMGWVSSDVGESHSWRGNGKMGCEVSLAQAGPTTVKVNLAWGTTPAKHTLRKADLVLKQ
ncbi:MAG: hypothetical protein KIT84_44930 [Labilithrix sp.]|nr:hypothetical protein [Labilithrix sp.]MCW5818227.1 hypothetical protein [Labilithrix sp.]